MLVDVVSAGGQPPTPRRPDREFIDDEPTATDGEHDPKRLGPGQRVGRYWLLEPVGRGGMGVVYLGYDPELHRKVAVKLLHEEPGGKFIEPRRLLREAQALAQVSHPNLIHVYDVGTFEGRVFMAMEMVAGRSLSKWFKERPPWQRVLEVMIAAGRGLVAAHGAGIVHRDLKPGNVILGDDGTVRVLDFGLARVKVDADGDSSRSNSTPVEFPPALTAELADEDEEPLTVGVVVGTPAYMAPEQHTGGLATVKSDQYAFCVTLYEGLYGERPWPRLPIRALAKLKRRGELRESPTDVNVPSWVRRVVLKGLSPDPDARFDSLDELLTRLTVRDRSSGLRWAAAVGAVAAVGTGAWLAGRAEVDAVLPCASAASALDGVWNEDRDQAIAAAFDATRLTYARATWQGLSPVVAGYAASWTQMRTDACRATHVDGSQSGALLDRRMVCLDRRRNELDAILGLYEAPDAEVVVRAADIASGLGSLERCADVEALTASVARPASDADREAVEVAERWLAEADALDAAGQHSLAERRARAAVAEGERMAYAPLVAEAKLMLATSLDNDAKLAEQTAREAIEIAAAAGADDTLRQAFRRLIFEIGVRQGRPRQVDGLVVAARAAWLRSGRDPDHDPSLQSDLGLLAAARGEPKRAREHFVRSLAALDAESASQVRRLVVAGNYAAALMQQGAWQEAREALGQARELGVQTYGEGHPFVADVDLNLGQIEAQTGHADAANLRYQAALDVLEASPDQHAERLALAYVTYASVAIVEGRPEAAAQRARRALGHLETTGNEHGPLAAAVFDALGLAASFEGQRAEAIVQHRLAVARATSGFGAASPNEAVARIHLAESLVMNGNWDEAREHSDAGAAVIADVFGVTGEHFAEVLLVRSALELADGNDTKAQASLRQALAQLPTGQAVLRARGRLRLMVARRRQGEVEAAANDQRQAEAALTALKLPLAAGYPAPWMPDAPAQP